MPLRLGYHRIETRVWRYAILLIQPNREQNIGGEIGSPFLQLPSGETLRHRPQEDPMQVEQPLTEAIRAFYATLRQRPTLSLDVAERAQHLTDFQLTDQRLSFTLERHPPILGRPAEGMLHYPHFLVEQHYVFDLTQHTLTLAQERCVGWAADA